MLSPTFQGNRNTIIVDKTPFTRFSLSFVETIENDELESYIEEILFNEFHTMAEDGSLPKVSFCTITT